jgi:hypothetical protein
LQYLLHDGNTGCVAIASCSSEKLQTAAIHIKRDTQIICPIFTYTHFLRLRLKKIRHFGSAFPIVPVHVLNDVFLLMGVFV